MGTGDRNPVALIEQCRQDIGPMENRQTDAPGFKQFRIILPDRAGYHDGSRIAEVRRSMSQINCRAAIGQTGGRFRRMQIRPGNTKSFFQQHVRDSTHAGAADPNKVKRLVLIKQQNGFLPQKT